MYERDYVLYELFFVLNVIGVYRMMREIIFIIIFFLDVVGV